MSRKEKIVIDLLEQAQSHGWELTRESAGMFQFQIETPVAGGKFHVLKSITIFVGERGGIEGTMNVYSIGNHWTEETSGKFAWGTITRWLKNP